MRDLSLAELECCTQDELIERIRDLQNQRLVWAQATERTCVRNEKLAKVARSACHLIGTTLFDLSIEVTHLTEIAASEIKELKMIIEEVEGR